MRGNDEERPIPRDTGLQAYVYQFTKFVPFLTLTETDFSSLLTRPFKVELHLQPSKHIITPPHPNPPRGPARARTAPIPKSAPESLFPGIPVVKPSANFGLDLCGVPEIIVFSNPPRGGLKKREPGLPIWGEAGSRTRFVGGGGRKLGRDVGEKIRDVLGADRGLGFSVD